MRNALISLALLSAVASAPLIAQDKTIDVRVNKLEKEMKAVQRKVFPGGVPVQPEIVPPAAVAATAAPAANPITDLTARIDALEGQLRMLTGQVETDSNRIRKLEDALKSLEMRTSQQALDGAAPTTAAPVAPAPIMAAPITQAPAAPAPRPVIVETPAPSAVDTIPMTAAPAARPVAPPPPPKPSASPAKAPPAPAATQTASAAKRKALVDAIEMPATGDAVEDAYTYAFRLWQANLYPEAQVKLKEFIAKNPRHRRVTFARNLLGRAYLDEGKPALASVAFYDNYTKNPKGDRASESLYYLGVSLTRLKKLPDACKVYDEFRDVYGSSASDDLKGRVAKGRAEAQCR